MRVDIKLILLVLFLIDATNTIIANYLDNKKYYAVTKSLMMPLLLATYLTWLPEKILNQPYQKFMIIAFVFHSVGDILLLFPKDKTKIYFYVGTMSFFVGHLFNIFWFSQPCWEHNLPLTIATIIAVLIIEILFAKQMISQNKKLGIALVTYSIILAVLVVFISSTKSVLAILGIFIFWISDYTIARREMKLKTTSNLVTITTYIVAQILIVLGMYFLQVK